MEIVADTTVDGKRKLVLKPTKAEHDAAELRKQQLQAELEAKYKHKKEPKEQKKPTKKKRATKKKAKKSEK